MIRTETAGSDHQSSPRESGRTWEGFLFPAACAMLLTSAGCGKAPQPEPGKVLSKLVSDRVLFHDPKSSAVVAEATFDFYNIQDNRSGNTISTNWCELKGTKPGTYVIQYYSDPSPGDVAFKEAFGGHLFEGGSVENPEVCTIAWPFDSAQPSSEGRVALYISPTLTITSFKQNRTSGDWIEFTPKTYLQVHPGDSSR